MATPTAIKRLKNDYKDIQNNPIPFISVKVSLTVENSVVIVGYYQFVPTSGTSAQKISQKISLFSLIQQIYYIVIIV